MPDWQSPYPGVHELELRCGTARICRHRAGCWCVSCEPLGVFYLLLKSPELADAKREALTELLAYVRLAETELARYVEAN